MSATTEERPNPGQLNSVQLNIITLVDVAKVNASGTVDGALYMMDNSSGGSGQGTAHLETVCKQGQVLNWIIYPMEMDKRPNGNWPPMPKINNIVFLDSEEEDDEDVTPIKVCTEFKIYGMADLMRSPYTPVYFYWAATVLSGLLPGVYKYRFVLEVEKDNKKGSQYLNTVEKPSIRVIPV